MAIRDRVTVRLVEGGPESMVVTRQGGAIDQRWPTGRQGGGLYEAIMLDKNGNVTDESIKVPVERIVAVVTDKAERAEKKKA